MSAVEVPESMLVEIDALVQVGAFASREVALAELLRLGLDALKARRRSPPIRPPAPPGVNDPRDDLPISVDPSDVKWMGRDPSGPP